MDDSVVDQSFAYRRVDWKYALVAPYRHEFTFPVLAGCMITNPTYSTRYVVDEMGISFKRGFGWDGPSGPMVDTRSAMIASLVHDALYRAIREGRIPPCRQKPADREFRRICKRDGMIWIRRWGAWIILRVAGRWWTHLDTRDVV